MGKARYYVKLDQVPQLNAQEKALLQPVTSRFAFRCSDYYLGLIDWEDAEDPIRRIAIPCEGELGDNGPLDASFEGLYTVAPGLEHKYGDTALLLVNGVCGGYCRFCFRKRLFMRGNDEVTRDISEAVRYIRHHPEISNVLLTGGDPLILSTRKLDEIIGQIRAIGHVRIVRIGTKMPAFNPYRILDDPALPDMVKKYSRPGRKLYFMCHFNHPRELTQPAREALHLLHRAGAVTVNQTPLIRGVNDDPEVLGDLFDELSFCGTPPYYVFQCRPTRGNLAYTVPIEKGYSIFLQAQMGKAGLAKRARFSMSHATGKIRVVGLDDDCVYMRFHRSAVPENTGRFLKLRRNPRAYWLDDYEEAAEIVEPLLEALSLETSA